MTPIIDEIIPTQPKILQVLIVSLGPTRDNIDKKSILFLGPTLVSVHFELANLNLHNIYGPGDRKKRKYENLTDKVYK